MNQEAARELAIACLTQVAPEIRAGEIDADADLREELDLDSMDFLNFVTGLSEATGVDVPERDYPQLATLRQCAEYLVART